MRRNQGRGIMEEESWKRHHGGGIMEEESWKRKHLDASWKHLGSIWGSSGRHLGDLGSPGAHKGDLRGLRLKT